MLRVDGLDPRCWCGTSALTAWRSLDDTWHFRCHQHRIMGYVLHGNPAAAAADATAGTDGEERA
jgi:hypothetical protein